MEWSGVGVGAICAGSGSDWSEYGGVVWCGVVWCGVVWLWLWCGGVVGLIGE